MPSQLTPPLWDANPSSATQTSHDTSARIVDTQPSARLTLRAITAKARFVDLPAGSTQKPLNARARDQPGAPLLPGAACGPARLAAQTAVMIADPSGPRPGTGRSPARRPSRLPATRPEPGTRSPVTVTTPPPSRPTPLSRLSPA